jgi:hypothetical protein
MMQLLLDAVKPFKGEGVHFWNQPEWVRKNAERIECILSTG